MKKFFIGLSLFLALVIVGLIIAISMVDLNKYKPKIEEAVKNSSGYELKINGDITTSFSPVGISISDVSLANPKAKSDKEFFTLKNIKVAVEVKPLLSKEIKVKYITLNDVTLSIKKLKNQKFNFEVEQKKPIKSEKKSKVSKDNKANGSLPLVNIKEVRLNNVNINYEDIKAKTKAFIKNVNVAVDDIVYDAKKKGLKAISFKADTKIANIIYNKFNIKNLSMNLGMKDAVATMGDMRFTVFDSLAVAKARLDLSKKTPYLDFENRIDEFKLASFSKEFLQKDILEGVIKATSKLSMNLGTQKQIKRTLKGTVLFDGQSVGIKGFDLDKALESVNGAKKMDIKSFGNSLASGPLMSVLSGKPLDLNPANGETTLLKHLHVKVDIAKHIANLTDIAVATGKNRVAIKGKLDIVKERLLKVEIGVLDKKGCATFSQTIEGSFSNPKVKMDQKSVEKTINTVVSLFGKFTGKKAPVAKKDNTNCKPFYNGVVKHPK